MTITQLMPGFWTVAAEEADLRIFRASSYTETGLSYRSYLLETAEGYVLLGSLPQRFAEQWVQTLLSHTGDKPISWAVFFGVDGDAAAYRALKAAGCMPTLICGQKTYDDIAPNAEDKSVIIRGNRSFMLGGKTLNFYVLSDRRETPSLYVLDGSSGTLFTADAFGADCALGVTSVSQLTDMSAWLRGAQLYYADIYASQRQRAMAKALALVEENAVACICHAFGPVVDTALEELLDIYRAASPVKGELPRLAVVCGPGQYLPDLAERMVQGAADTENICVKRYDMSALSREQLLRELEMADAYVFGVPYEWDGPAKGLWDVLTSLRREDVKGKLAACFHTKGADSPLAEQVRAHLSMLGMNLNTNDLVLSGKPEQQELNQAYEFGYAMGCLLQGIPNDRKPSLVKCLVCGEVFDASLGICPVCGVGLEQCVPAQADESAYRVHTQRRYLIIGGGVAGVSAAEAIRLRDDGGSIVLLSAENCLPINRPMLSKDLTGVESAPEALAIHDANWYDQRDIQVHLGVSVTAIDPQQKTVNTADGGCYAYDKLIYAAGAESFVPPFTGAEKQGVLTLRHLEDTLALCSRIKTAKNAVVIGGGVIGLEAASELMRAGVKVTVLEAAPQIIAQLDSTSAERLREQMKRFGVDCHENVSIEALTGGETVDGVQLADGRHFPADIVLVSCGVRANIAPLTAAGAAAERAIVVNHRMETSLEDIYACGDCCQMEGVNYQLWQEAAAQGRAAGANAAGEKVSYANTPLPLSYEGFGTSLFAMGETGKGPQACRTVTVNDDVRRCYESYWFRGHRLVGAALMGAPEKAAAVTQALIEHRHIEQVF